MYKYIVTNNQQLTETTRLLTVECADENSPMLYRPGQYAAIGLKDRVRPTVMRCFSIASSPSNQQVIQFSMRVKGKYTSAVQRLKPGDSVVLRGPFGGFVYNQQIHDDAVFFAGGIGIAPFVSMVRYATDTKLSNPIHLVFSCRDQTDIPFFEELNYLQKLNPKLKVSYVIGSGPTNRLSGERVFQGTIDSKMLTALSLKYSTQTFFICGPPPYMKAVNQLLLKHGVLGQNILTEAFSQGSHKQTGKLISWPFNMYAMTGLTLLVGGFYITASDLYKTIPKLQSNLNSQSSSPSTAAIDRNGITSLSPQVDTNINQKPVQSSSSSPGAYSSTPQQATPQTTISPSPTVINPTPAPRTVVSPAP